ncbi:MAG: oligosaccharide flippase family protein [Bacilli bacterium]|nr:oligosaccharide flippase family protein [Bacilli bacterium]
MKNKFIKSSIILIIGGFLTKLLGMLIKITIVRNIKEEGLGLYMLILPTFMLFINISQFGFPLSLSKLVSEDNKSNKKLYLSIFPILILINILLILIIIVFAPFISNNLLHNNNTYLSIISISLVIPFTSISSICRSYFFGKNKMFPHIISNITEDIVRLFIISFGIKKVIPLGLPIVTTFLVLSNIISEISSTLVLLFFLPKNITLKKSDFIPNRGYIKDNLQIAIPTTTSRLIGSFTYFLEPIILTSTLLKVGYKKSYILKEYGILTGTVIPLILLPSFFTSSISQALLPTITKEYQKRNKKNIKKTLTLAIILSLGISTLATITLVNCPSLLLEKIYHTKEGVNYIKILAPICILQYIEYPLSITLDAFGKTKENLKISIINLIIRTFLLYLFSLLKIGIYSLILTISINIIITSTYLIKKVRKHLKNL